MPKETINAQTPPYNVQVGWGPHSVQVGTSGTDGRSLNWLLHGTRVEQIGQQVRALMQVTYEDDAELGRALLNTLDTAGGDYTGVWSDLDRVDCNQLIRVLRRARDHAYGRDE